MTSLVYHRAVAPSIDLDLLRPTWASLPLTLILAMVLGTALVMPSAAAELWGLPWTQRRRDLAGALALFTLALGLRWTLGSHALIHENHHGYRYLAWTPAINALADAHGVPSAHLVLLRMIGGDAGAFALDAFFSASAVVALAAYTSLAARSRRAGLTAGALLALQPLAIALATTEEFLVSASALSLGGIALLHVGAARRRPATLALGTLLLCLAACAREITLPLAALALPALLSARTAEGRVPWGPTLAVTGSMTALLLPQALRVVAAWRGLAATPGYMGSPNLPWTEGLHRNPAWVGWMEPYIPRWEAWWMVLGFAALVGWCFARRDLRRALGLGVVPLIALMQGGLVRSGWFPTGLRHQLLALAMLLIPVGWSLAAITARLPRGWRSAAPWAVAVLAAVSLYRRPHGYRIDAPHTQEYHFFHDSLAVLPARGVVTTFDEDLLPHVAGTWVTAQRPRWGLVAAAALPRLPSAELSGPVFLLLDRVCFLNPSCINPGPRGCGDAPDATPSGSVETPFGRMSTVCATALGALPWRTVASRSIVRASGAAYDLPSFDATVRLAVLRWDRP